MPVLGVLIAVGLTMAAVAVGIAARRMSAAWLKFRGRRVVTCPGDHRPAGVTVDAAHAALTACGGRLELRLSGCSHWPDRAACGQPCLSQIEAAPQDCLVRSILAKWYEGKYCVRCGTPVGEIYWTGCPPALLTSSDVIKEWSQIPAAQLLDTLGAARPVCFHCYVQENAGRHPWRLTAS
jgi:hypothetical protein